MGSVNYKMMSENRIVKKVAYVTQKEKRETQKTTERSRSRSERKNVQNWKE